jgi:CHAT domain-containing protein
MVVYWTLPEKICIWVLSREQLWFESSHTSSETIEEWVSQARRFIAGNSMSRMEGPLKDLYNVLIEPVEHHLSGFDNWIIVPKGSMHFLPFQALMNSEGQFLVDQSVISYAPSASVWKLAGDAKASTGEGFLGMALGDLAIGNSRGLPGTRSELESISPLFTPTDTYYSEEATETIFKNTAGDKEFIHLATHGYTDFYDPIYSFLLFPPNEEDDGRLLLTEVMGRRLDASLVTLSACQTGLGNITEGDDLVSLNRAFIYAGSPAVISSLWDVSDYTTALLMEEFYRQCATHSFAKALTLAQRKVKSQFQSPSYWAPFVLNGNGLLKKSSKD